jgi:CRP-like cAMP-binding protein
VEQSRIAAIPAFAGLPASELDELAAAVREIAVDTGAKVLSVDDYGDALYFVEQGEADVLGNGGEAGEVLGPGDVFGEIALLLTGQRTATVVARSPMRFLSLSGRDFERIRERVPEFEATVRTLALERAAR